MKTQFQQVLLVVSFFSLTLIGIFAVSWGMTNMLFSTANIEQQEITVLKAKTRFQTRLDLKESFRMLIPNLK